MSLRTLHRASAAFVAAFACLHIANHLVGLRGVSSHVAFMEEIRPIYRHALIEGPLLFGIAFQVGSGLWLLASRWQERRGLVPWLQAASGGYLAFFLLVHVGAVLFGRHVLNLDTNFYFAAAGMHVAPNGWFFVPYYFLAPVALFTHLGCAAYWLVPTASLAARRLAVVVPAAIGFVLSLLIVLSLAGWLHPVQVPDVYKAPYVGKAG